MREIKSGMQGNGKVVGEKEGIGEDRGGGAWENL